MENHKNQEVKTRKKTKEKPRTKREMKEASNSKANQTPKIQETQQPRQPKNPDSTYISTKQRWKTQTTKQANAPNLPPKKLGFFLTIYLMQ